MLLALLGSPTCPGATGLEQYDSNVQSSTVAAPGKGAAVPARQGRAEELVATTDATRRSAPWTRRSGRDVPSRGHAQRVDHQCPPLGVTNCLNYNPHPAEGLLVPGRGRARSRRPAPRRACRSPRQRLALRRGPGFGGRTDAEMGSSACSPTSPARRTFAPRQQRRAARESADRASPAPSTTLAGQRAINRLPGPGLEKRTQPFIREAIDRGSSRPTDVSGVASRSPSPRCTCRGGRPRPCGSRSATRQRSRFSARAPAGSCARSSRVTGPRSSCSAAARAACRHDRDDRWRAPAHRPGRRGCGRCGRGTRSGGRRPSTCRWLTPGVAGGQGGRARWEGSARRSASPMPSCRYKDDQLMHGVGRGRSCQDFTAASSGDSRDRLFALQRGQEVRQGGIVRQRPPDDLRGHRHGPQRLEQRRSHRSRASWPSRTHYSTSWQGRQSRRRPGPRCASAATVHRRHPRSQPRRHARALRAGPGAQTPTATTDATPDRAPCRTRSRPTPSTLLRKVLPGSTAPSPRGHRWLARHGVRDPHRFRPLVARSA